MVIVFLIGACVLLVVCPDTEVVTAISGSS